MPGDTEFPLFLRGFEGVDIATDPAFVAPTFLQHADNWLPSSEGLLSRRRGTVPLINPLAFGGGGRAEALTRVYLSTGDRLTFVVAATPTIDQIQYSLNEGDYLPVVGAAPFSPITTRTGRFGSVLYGNRVYFGNGVDPIAYVDTSGPGLFNSIIVLAATNEAGSAVTVPAATATAAELPSGEYTYCWSVYDATNKRFDSRGAPRTVVVNAGNYLHFTAPNTALAAGKTYELFVAPRGWPIEFAYRQTPTGLAAAATFDLNNLTATGNPAPVKDTIVRTGRWMIAHRGRIWMVGDLANPSAAYATGVILPGLEQSVYDQGHFFPVGAFINVSKNDGDQLTGIALASQFNTNNDPQAAVVLFKNYSTWMWLGDIIGDPTAQLLQVSGHVGCASHNTIVPTPVGLIFCALDSVYLLTAGSPVPIDIGYAIAPAIAAIPASQRQYSHAVYHNYFYKLSITPPGASSPQQSWWLNLRGGLGDAPRWWGPMTRPGWHVSAHARNGVTAADSERSILALIDANGLTTHLDEQDNVYTDNGASMMGQIKMKALDAGKPFERKVFTRVRVNGRPIDTAATLIPTLTLDGGVTVSAPANILLDAPTAAEWETSDWETADWATTAFTEGETTFYPRPLGLYAEMTLTHPEAAPCDLRDFELSYLPEVRTHGPNTPGKVR